MSSVPPHARVESDPSHRCTRSIIGIGAGGHARVMIPLTQQCGYRMRCLLEPASGARQRVMLDGIDIEYTDEEHFYVRLIEKSRSGSQVTAVRYRRPAAVLCIGTGRDTNQRRQVYQRIRSIGYATPTLVAPSAIIEPHVSLGDGVHVLPAALIAAGAVLGENVLVNHRAVIEHDCVIGHHVHVASGSVLCGGVRLGDGVFVGAGSVLLPGIEVGDGAVIGAGSTVTKDVPGGQTYIGNPARSLSERRRAA